MTIKFDRTFGLLENSIGGSVARQKAIAHNVSNIDTPGFKRFLVDVEQQLQNARESRPLPLQKTRSQHLSRPDDVALHEKRDYSPGLRADGNNVDLELEMINLIKNDYYYNAGVQQLNKKIAMMKFAIDGK